MNDCFFYFFARKFLLMIAALLLLTSCGSRRNVVLLQDMGQRGVMASTPVYKAVIVPDDKLSIIVSCADMEVAAPYNAPMTTYVQSTGYTTNNNGYIVDKNGCIDFPTLGRIQVEGLSRDQLVNLLQVRLSEQIKDPTVTIQFLNFRVTVLGAVRNPGTYTMPSERVSIFDALGKAGDMQLKSKRKNVLVVRDNGGEVAYGRLDLTKGQIFNSQFYYLQQNDVVYVEPSKSNIQDGTTSSFLPYLLGIVSSALAVVAIFVR